MASRVSLDWIEEIKEELFLMEQAPALPPTAPFPIEALEKELQTRLGLEAHITLGRVNAMGLSELQSQLVPSTSRLFSIMLSPYNSPLYALITHDALQKVGACLLAEDMEAAVSLQSSLQESFYLFLGAAALDAIQATKYLDGTALRLVNTAADAANLPAALALPVNVALPHNTLSLLLLFSPGLKQEMLRAKQASELALLQHSLLASSVQIAVRLCVGLISLHAGDLKHISVGAFIVMPAHVTPAETAVQLIVGKKAFFSGAISGMTTTVSALATPLEEIKKMEQAPLPKAPPSIPQQGEPKAAPPEAPHQEVNSGGTPASSPINKAEGKLLRGEDEEFFVEDAELKDILQKEEAKTATGSPPPAVEPPQHEEIDPVAISDVPLHIEVVVGYMRLSIKELLAMRVGSTYTLANPISSHVDLLVNGKRIAKGELLKSGSLLGVRILSV